MGRFLGLASLMSAAWIAGWASPRPASSQWGRRKKPTGGGDGADGEAGQRRGVWEAAAVALWLRVRNSDEEKDATARCGREASGDFRASASGEEQMKRKSQERSAAAVRPNQVRM